VLYEEFGHCAMNNGSARLLSTACIEQCGLNESDTVLILVKEKLTLAQDDASQSYSGRIVGPLLYVPLDF
jgi:hypothetical protein